MTNAEINAAISAWFEPKPDGEYKDTVSLKGFWTFTYVRGEGVKWYPSWDFFQSEDANARLVDRLLSEGKHLMYVQQLKGGVLLWVDHTHSHLGKDRREANVLAFLKFAGIAHKRDGGERA